MADLATVDLNGLHLVTDIGTYGPHDVVPDVHVLDLSLRIDPAQVLVPSDGMAHVFDYDPLITEIDRLARDGHYETQEWLMHRITRACAAYPEIKALEIALRKSPVLHGSGTLGVRLTVTAETLDAMRPA